VKEILPTQFEDAPLKVEGSLLGKICQAISSLKPSIGWGLRASQTDAGFHFEVDRDQIKDPQLKIMQVISIEESADGSYPEVIKAAPPGNRDDIHVVSIATPELKAGLLEADANDPSYDNAYHEYIETVWRKSGVIRFVGFRLAAPTGNFAVDGDGHTIDVYWLAEAARVQNFVINNLSGDPWISVGIDAIDLGQVDDEGEPIFSVVSKVKHKEVTNADPSLQYDTAETGSTNQSLSLVTWANPNLTITPVTLAQDDAGHIHTFTAGGDTVANLAGASDELVASQAGQAAGYLGAVARAVANADGDTHLSVAANAAFVDWTHTGPGAQDYTFIIESDDADAGGGEWLTVTKDAAAAVAGLSFDGAGHERDVAAGNNTVNITHNDPQAVATFLETVTQITNPGTTVVRWTSNTVPTDAKGHVDTASVTTDTHDITFSATAPLTATVTGFASNLSVTYAIDWSAVSGYSAGADQVLSNNSGTVEWDAVDGDADTVGGASVVDVEIKMTDTCTVNRITTISDENFSGRKLHWQAAEYADRTDAQWADYSASSSTQTEYIGSAETVDRSIAAAPEWDIFVDVSDGYKLKHKVVAVPASGKNTYIRFSALVFNRKTTPDFTVST